MSKNELMEKASSLDCLLKCLAAVDTDNALALQGLPQALKIAAEYAETIFEEIANNEEV